MGSAELEPKWRIKEWFPDFDERTYERLRIFHLELTRWTNTINLISASSVLEADRIHFADGIAGAQLILPHIKDEHEIWDIGSGNGIPGVFFSILRPELGVMCLDSDERKAAFIKTLALRLQLNNLAARCERFEKVQSDSISCAVARGFAPLLKTLTVAQQKVVVGGRFFSFKSVDYKSEMEIASPQVRSTWNTELVGTYNLPPADGTKQGEMRSILRSTRI